MKKRTKKSGYTRNRTAPQPDGCASGATPILARKDWLVTLAKVSIGIGMLLLFCLAGRGDYEHLTGTESMGDTENALMCVTAMTAMVTGFIALKLEGIA